MDANRVLLVSLLAVASLAQACYGQILLSKLPMSLSVTASPQQGQLLKAEKDKLTVTWSTVAGTDDSAFKTVKAKFCYAPVSQKQRGWRKTVDDLHKDKTCPHLIVAKPYTRGGGNTTIEYTIAADVPQATYFIRAYAFNAEGHQLGYGQTTDKNKTTHLFQIQAVTGRNMSLDIASISFSVFSIAALAFFFVLEKSRAKNK